MAKTRHHVLEKNASPRRVSGVFVCEGGPWGLPHVVSNGINRDYACLLRTQQTRRIAARLPSEPQ